MNGNANPSAMIPLPESANAVVDQSAKPSVAKGLACAALALCMVLVPLVIFLLILMRLLATDGDLPRELGEETMYISVNSPTSVVSSAAMYLGAPGEPLEFGADSGGPLAIYVRFPLELPPGLAIESADIVFRCHDNRDGRGTMPMDAVIEMLDTADQPPFSSSTYSSASDLKSIKVDWDLAKSWPVDVWEGGESYATPDLAAMVEKFLAHPDYRPRNAIGFRIRGEAETHFRTDGKGMLRSVAGFESGMPPTLRIVIAAP